MKFTFALSLLLVGTARSQDSGTFTRTGDLTTGRESHTATLLTNGKVLITGGWAIATDWPVWASAELYDPSTGSFTRTGDMTTARANHSATLLPDGKVLITGGFSSIVVGSSWNGALTSAELYDPSTGSFIRTGDMSTARYGHTATLLPNGKVLIAGGSRNQPLGTAELYDPSTGTFAATGQMITPGLYTATLLSDGKVLFEGGYGSTADGNAIVNELYDPGTGSFSVTTAKANLYVFPATASLLTNGNVLVTEEYSCDYSDLAEVYDPQDGTSAATGPMTKFRGYSTATLLPEGRVLIAGESYFSGYNGSAELYDPVTGTFSASSAMVTRSSEGHTATLLPDGTVLLAGGWLCCGYTVATADIYHPVVQLPSPVLYTVGGGAQGALLHAATELLVSPSNPAVTGEALEIYGAGLIEGSVIPPQVVIGGQMAEVLYFGNAPGYPGLNQINVLTPSGVTPGSAVKVWLNYLSRPSNEVAIPVQ